MTEALKIGELMLRDAALEKRIGEIRDEARRRALVLAALAQRLNRDPEGVVFDGDAPAELPSTNAIARKDVDAGELAELLFELRSTIREKQSVRDELARSGLDIQQIEDEALQRKSRALRFPAVAGGEEKRSGAIGFDAHKQS